MNRTDGFYAWTRAVVSLALMTIGGVGIYACIVALKPIAADFGTSRSEISLAYSATFAGFGLGGVLMGTWSDRVGVVPPVLTGSLGVGFGLIIAGCAPTPEVLIAAQGLLVGLFGNSAVFVPLIADITRWFERNRGIAVALVISGNYAAGTLWPPVVQYGIEHFGWRQTFVGLGLFCVLTMALLSFLLLPASPPDPETPGDRGARSRPLGFSPAGMQCLLCVAGLACCIAMAVPQAHIVAHVTDLGFAAVHGAQMLALMLGFGIVSRLTYGWISDRIGGIPTLILGSMMQAVVLALFIATTSLGGLYAMSLLFGLSQGGIVPAYAIIVRTVYPLDEVGWRIGTVMLFTMLGMAFGGWLAGVIYDLTGSYGPAFFGAVLVNLVNLAIATTFLLRRDRQYVYA